MVNPTNAIRSQVALLAAVSAAVNQSLAPLPGCLNRAVEPFGVFRMGEAAVALSDRLVVLL